MEGKATYHEIHHIQQVPHLPQRYIRIVIRPSRRRNRQQEMRLGLLRIPLIPAQILRICIHLPPNLLQQRKKLQSLLFVPRILPIHINPVKPIILNHIHAALCKVLARGITFPNWVELLIRVGICPATDAEQDFEVAVLLLEKAELLEGAVDVFARVAPGIAGIVHLDVGVAVAEGDVSRGRIGGESVEEVGQFGGRDGLREVFAGVDVLFGRWSDGIGVRWRMWKSLPSFQNSPLPCNRYVRRHRDWGMVHLSGRILVELL